MEIQDLLKNKYRSFIDFDCKLLAICLCCMIYICLHWKKTNQLPQLILSQLLCCRNTK